MKIASKVMIEDELGPSIITHEINLNLALGPSSFRVLNEGAQTYIR